jgi:small subunit ribosomal protein S18
MAPKKIIKKRRSSAVRLRPVAVNCPFCKGKTTPDYKKYQDLARYLTDRAKIVPKSRTGLCAKHQRRLAIAIKRARHLGLLPFTGSI